MISSMKKQSPPLMLIAWQLTRPWEEGNSDDCVHQSAMCLVKDDPNFAASNGIIRKTLEFCGMLGKSELVMNQVEKLVMYLPKTVGTRLGIVGFWLGGW